MYKYIFIKTQSYDELWEESEIVQLNIFIKYMYVLISVSACKIHMRVLHDLEGNYSLWAALHGLLAIDITL